MCVMRCPLACLAIWTGARARGIARSGGVQYYSTKFLGCGTVRPLAWSARSACGVVFCERKCCVSVHFCGFLSGSREGDDACRAGWPRTRRREEFQLYVIVVIVVFILLLIVIMIVIIIIVICFVIIVVIIVIIVIIILLSLLLLLSL